MKIKEKLYDITLTENEVEMIDNALAEWYKIIVSNENDYEKIKSIRELRNGMAKLLNKFYMGNE